jgi:hypothetical protein
MINKTYSRRHIDKKLFLDIKRKKRKGEKKRNCLILNKNYK